MTTVDFHHLRCIPSNYISENVTMNHNDSVIQFSLYLVKLKIINFGGKHCRQQFYIFLVSWAKKAILKVNTKITTKKKKFCFKLQRELKNFHFWNRPIPRCVSPSKIRLNHFDESPITSSKKQLNHFVKSPISSSKITLSKRVGVNCSKFDCSTIICSTLLAGNQLLDTKFINCSNPVNPG